jgi:hypothetical protein
MPIYMNYPGITGNVPSVAGLPGQWIEISSFQWGVGRGISSGSSSSSDREGSVPSVSEVVVTKPKHHHHFLRGIKVPILIIFTNVLAGGPRHTLALNHAVITNIKPHNPQGRGDKLTMYEKLTITFPEYHFNGVRNGVIPHDLARFQSV